MSAAGTQTIVAPGSFTIDGGIGAGPQTFNLYSLSGIYAERVETVYMTVPWGSNDETNNVLVVQLVAPNGDILYEQATPPMEGVDAADLECHCTWSRLGNDSSNQAAIETLFASDNVRRAWFNMRLPDLVLPPLSAVNLLAYLDNGEEGPSPTVTDASVTTTRNAGSVSSTTPVFPLPLLAPTDGS